MGGRPRGGCKGGKPRPPSGMSLHAARSSGRSSGVKLSLEASPARPASAGPFPTAHSQGAARLRSYSSPRLRPRLGLIATPSPLRVLPSPDSRWGPRRTHLPSAPPEPVVSLPLSSWPPQSTSPIPSHLPACHGSLFKPRNPVPPTVGQGEGKLGAWSHPHQTICTPSLVKGADPQVTPDLGGGSPASCRERDLSPYCLQTLPQGLECPPALAPALPLPWASHQHTSGTSRF